jgi:microcystin-dependent protein
MTVVSPTAKAQFIDAAGVPLAGGFLYTYAAGTTTPQATYTDSTGATANSNPIVLDARGEANIWLGSATYKFKLADSNNTEIWTVDNVVAPSTSVSPVLAGNVTISTDNSGTALTITQTGSGAALKVQDSIDPDVTPFIITTTGAVGIGTATPANAIDIADGSIQLSSIAGTARTIISADSTDSIFAASDTRNFTIKTNSATRLTINATDATSTVPIVLPAIPTTALQAATKSYVDQVLPPGSLMAYGASTAPTGWLLCDGSAVSRTTYATLYGVIGTTWGAGDTTTTFNVPDLRGQFVRGYDDRAPATSQDTTTISGITTNTSTTVNGINSTTYLYAGMKISGTGIPSGATISSVSTNSIVISAAATASSTSLASSSTTNASTTVTVSSTSNLFAGQAVSGSGIPTGAYIVSVTSSTTITISSAATATATVTLSFGTTLTVGRTFASAQADAYLNHNHSDSGHTHTYTTPNANQNGPTGVGTSYVASSTAGTATGTGYAVIQNSITGNVETRPKNYAVLYIIKT